MNKKPSWDNNLAYVWTRMVGPSRPTITEIAVFTKYVRVLQKQKKRRLNILILGSTPEFRDWAFEENMIVTVMDYSQDYHNTISREIRHKSIVEKRQGKERYICDNWLNMKFENEFDIIIGDLVIGNIPPESLDEFLNKVSVALKEDGLFLGKSFFEPDNHTPTHPKDLIKQYYEGPEFHPYSALAFDLTMYSMEDNILEFKKQYNVLKKLYDEGLITDETMQYFEGVGWDIEMKFTFHVPKISTYEKLLRKHFNIHNIEYAQEVYSDNFPLYIVNKKNSNIFGGK